jgi:hydroxyethylthiazole kinase-like uncharacterized protein yjeF
MITLHDSLPQSLFHAHEIRQIEKNAAALAQAPDLMARAGLAVAESARAWLGNGSAILVLAGPGNNGGDALIAARHLKQWWYKVDVVFTGQADKLPPDAAKAYSAWLDSGGTLLEDLPQNGRWDWVIDGLFGIGLDRDLDEFPQTAAACRGYSQRVGQRDWPALSCRNQGKPHTDFPRFETWPAHGLWARLLWRNSPRFTWHRCNIATCCQRALACPARNRVLHEAAPAEQSQRLGGAESMCGAAFLAGRAALKLGAGRVYLGLLADNAPAMDTVQPELMLRAPAHLFDLLDQLSCLVVGPGLGQSDAAFALMEQALSTDLPLVLDADALNLIATHPELGQQLKARKAQSILTPHPAEAARLMGCGSHDIQQDRLGAALVLAGRYNSMVVLKGAGTICALPDENWWINPTGNPGLSSAGMGDVLAGMIGAFIAQRVNPRQATLLGVYLHGAAADELVRKGIGPVGLTASEVIDAARALINQWVYST